MKNVKKDSMDKDGFLHMRIPKMMLEEFQEIARSQDETASHLVRKFIREYISYQKTAQRVRESNKASTK